MAQLEYTHGRRFQKGGESYIILYVLLFNDSSTCLPTIVPTKDAGPLYVPTYTRLTTVIGRILQLQHIF